MKLLFIAIIAGLLLIAAGNDDSPKAWHEKIEWVMDMNDALRMSKDEDRPIMLIIHKSWCGACKALKPQFHDSKDIGDLSKNFIMVLAGDDAKAIDAEYQPDGKAYIPRIIFIKDGKMVTDIYNEKGNPNYKYFYSKPEHILISMKKAVDLYGSKTDNLDKEDL